MPRITVSFACFLCAAPAFAQGLLLERGQEGATPHLRAVRERVRVRIDRQYAETVLEQEFENVSDQRLEGVYLLRTGGALVRGFAYWNGEQKIVGEVFEKESARNLYGAVTGLGRDPGLLEQVGEGSFSFRVFPIEPGERKRVEVRFGQRLQRLGRLLEYRTTLGGGQSEILVDIEDDRPVIRVDSSSHPVEITRIDARKVRARAVGRPAGPRDLVLAVELEAGPWEPRIVVHRDPGQDPYLVLQLAAPPQIGRRDVSAKDVTIVIDKSGSMTGAPLDEALDAAALVVTRLQPGDRVNVIAFDHETEPLFPEPRPIEGARDLALRFIRRIRPGGGTDIAAALRQALSSRGGGSAPHLVLFLTDGQSDSQAALRVAREDPGDARVFTIGLGGGVQKPLLSRLASMKRGRFTYIESAEAIEQRVAHLFDRIEAPALVGLSLEARGATLASTYPRTLPDLGAGDDLLVAARVLGAPGSTLELVVHGTLGGRQVQFPATVRLPETASHPWAGRVWAKARADDVLEEIALHGARPDLRDEVVELGIAYGLVTPYTSFLAIPESELNGEQAQTLHEMREHRRKAIAQHRDAAALSRQNMPPGDPLLTVDAPSDARQVTAFFPFGLEKDLSWDARIEKWVVRFLVPRDVPDGEYEATVVIVRRDGTVETAKARYTIDSRAPDFEVQTSRVAGGIRVRVVSSEAARRVTAAIAARPGSRIELEGDGTVFEGILRAPRPGTLRVVVADRARNETAREVEPR